MIVANSCYSKSELHVKFYVWIVNVQMTNIMSRSFENPHGAYMTKVHVWASLSKSNAIGPHLFYSYISERVYSLGVQTNSP